MRNFVLGLALGAALVAFWPALARGFGSLDIGLIAGTSASPSASAAPAGTGTGVTAQIAAVDRALTQARQSGKAVPVTLTFTNADLTASAAAYFPQSVSGATLTNPVIRLQAGQVVLDMTATAAFVRTTATVTATVAVQNGRPATTVTSATIGGAPLPQAVTASVAAQLDQALAAGLPARFVVSSITIGNGVMTVVGLANP